MDLARTPLELPTCEASRFSKVVDEKLNAGARQEFDDVMQREFDGLDGPLPSDIDQGEGNAYLDPIDSEVEFKPQSAVCGLCRGVAALSRDGSVSADKCRSSQMCEMEWAKKYPEEYIDVVDKGGALCSVEVDCSAFIGMNNDGTPKLLRGYCQLALRGDAWQKRRSDVGRREPTIDPSAGIPEFDGLEL